MVVGVRRRHRAGGHEALAPAHLDDDVQAWLLRVARAAVRAGAGVVPVAAIATAVAAEPGGAEAPRRGMAFVTLRDGDELRGCIGRLDPWAPLGEAVAHAAFGAARHDRRFEPVRPPELSRLHVDVSVLGPIVPLDEPQAFRPGVDGLVVERGADRGLLLPEVATAHDLDREGMLRAVCRKAGLPVDAWRDPGTTLWVFQTVRFGGALQG